MVEAEQGDPMADDSDAKQFGEALLKSVQDLAKQIEVMGQRFTAVEARQREIPKGFQVDEGSDTSHHLQEKVSAPHQASHAPIRATMPTFLSTDTGTGAREEPDSISDYFFEYQAAGYEFRDAILFKYFV